MVGNVALDVVIGLVFIYLLYSLYATIIMEFVSSFLGLRARNLNYALKRMLMDEKKYENHGKKWLSQLLTTVTSVWGKSTNLKNRYLYNEFFDQPNIKYVSSGGLNNKPSYLNPENFSKGVIDVLKDRDPDISVLAGVEQGLSKLPEDSETRKHLQSLLDDANNDVVKFKILLEQWYNETMDRATGWFKRSTQVILVAIGFILAISFNVDSIAIIKKLSTDKEAREQLVKMATDFTQDNAELIEAVRNKKDTTQSVVALTKRLDSLQAIKSSLEEDIQASQTTLGAQWHIASPLKYGTDSLSIMKGKDNKIVLATINNKKAYVIVHKSIDAETLREILPKEAPPGWIEISPLRYKLCYVFSWDYFWGYLMTVLALSLGAPFWFDLLNKLVKLRSSKAISAEPEGKSGTSGPVVNRTILNRAG